MLIPRLQHYASVASTEYGELATVVGASARTAEKFIGLMKLILVETNLPQRPRDVGTFKRLHGMQ